MPPRLTEELELYAQGHRLVVGLDEVGRGAWAGPVVAAAVVLPLESPGLEELLRGVDDSKLLSPRLREELAPLIRRTARSWAVGAADPAVVDLAGIVPATRLAMLRALGGLDCPVSCLLVDGLRVGQVPLPQRALVGADARCLSVAAASILAKVHRDELMRELDRRYPGYGFAAHKGYGTAEHQRALARLGPCPLHRLSWAPFLTAPTGPAAG